MKCKAFMASRSGMIGILCLTVACTAKDDRRSPISRVALQDETDVRAEGSQPGDASGDRVIFTSTVREGKWYRAGQYRVRSIVSRTSITPAADLPAIVYRKDANDGCATRMGTRTPEGRWARSRGCRVNAEATLGPLTLVNILRTYSYGPAALTCGEVDGRVLVFDHGKPIATISAGVVAGGTTIQAFEDTDRGALRLENLRGDSPFGDLFVTGRDIEIRPLPSSDTVCNGTRTVPNIFDKPIVQARRVLGKAGWEPIKAAPPRVEVHADGSLAFLDNDDWITLYRSGVHEVMECSNTSYCSFQYGSGGTTLHVDTEGKRVTYYDVDCAARPWK